MNELQDRGNTRRETEWRCLLRAQRARDLILGMQPIAIRRAEPADLPRIAAFAAELVHFHHHTDPQRFMLVEDVEGGYRWWLGRELKRKEAIILVALHEEALVGYCYATREERDWNMLLDEHGAIHDLFVASEARKRGVGASLLEAMIKELEALGARRIVLSTMIGNEAAQAVFRAHGFRPTMLEMTRGG